MKRFACSSLASLAVFALTLTGGCARLTAHEMDTRLHDAVRSYANALRWGDVQRAALFTRRRDDSAAHVTAYPAGLRVLAVNATPTRSAPDAGEAVVPIRIEYMEPVRGSVQVFEAAQRWWYDAHSGRWFVDGTLPELGKDSSQHQPSG